LLLKKVRHTAPTKPEATAAVAPTKGGKIAELKLIEKRFVGAPPYCIFGGTRPKYPAAGTAGGTEPEKAPRLG